MEVKLIKAEAKELGVRWADVEAVYRTLREAAQTGREREAAIRQAAWERLSPEGCHEFWRHGFGVRYRQAFGGGGDRDNIRRFDEAADGLAYTFPELRAGDDPAEALWEILNKQYAAQESADTLYLRALESIHEEHERQRRAAAADESIEFPFGANVAEF